MNKVVVDLTAGPEHGEAPTIAYLVATAAGDGVTKRSPSC